MSKAETKCLCGLTQINYGWSFGKRVNRITDGISEVVICYPRRNTGPKKEKCSYAWSITLYQLCLDLGYF